MGGLAFFHKHSDDCKKSFAYLCAGKPWPPPMPEKSASAALAALLSRKKTVRKPPPACTATWIAEPASGNPILIHAEEKAEAFEFYIGDLTVTMSEFKEGIDRESARDAIRDLPERVKRALAAPAIASPWHET